jgi:hypothetical protein
MCDSLPHFLGYIINFHQGSLIYSHLLPNLVNKHMISY